MKIPNLFLLVLLFIWLSCQKERAVEVYPGAAINSEEAVALLEGALARDAEGLMAELETAIEITQSGLAANSTQTRCEISRDSVRMKNFNATRFDGSISTNCLWQLHCDGQHVPLGLVYSWEGDVGYESLRWVAEDYTDGIIYLSKLVSGTDYLASGNYQRTGRQESKVRIHKIFSIAVTFGFTDLVVDKLTRSINRGSATFAISGTSAEGQSLYLNGTLIFLGDDIAQVTLKGTTYSINL